MKLSLLWVTERIWSVPEEGLETIILAILPPEFQKLNKSFTLKQFIAAFITK